MDITTQLREENERLKKFLSMDFRHAIFYIKSASDQLKESESLDPQMQAELLQGISLAVEKSMKIMAAANPQ